MTEQTMRLHTNEEFAAKMRIKRSTAKPHDFEMISAEEFAARMGVSRSTVFAWLAKGHLPEGKVYVRIGKTIRFIWSIETIAAMSEKNASESLPESSEPLNFGRKSAVNLDF